MAERNPERNKDRTSPQVPARQNEGEAIQAYGREPFGGGPLSLIDWMFDRLQRDFFGGPFAGFGSAMEPFRGPAGFERLPRIDVSETEQEVVVAADVPGIDPNDIGIDCGNDVLTIRAESRLEGDEEGGRVSTRRRFFRQLPLPSDVDVDKASASCKNGVVTIRFPKLEQGRNVRRIPISSGGAAEGKERAA